MSNFPSPSVTTRHAVESLRVVDLIGHSSHVITGAKLPSSRQVLQVFFYNMRFVKLSTKDSANLALDAAMIFWQQASIPTRRIDKCTDQLLKLYDNWNSIRKTAPSKRSEFQKEAEKTFVDNLDNLFDIASQDALQQMRNEEDKQFLNMQRQRGRPGCMAGVDLVLLAREKRSVERIEREQLRKRKYEEMSGACDPNEEFENESVETVDELLEPTETDDQTAIYSATRGTKNWITPRILSALDNAKVSDGAAIHILIATAVALGHQVDELVINRSTIQRLRRKHRQEESEKIQADLVENISSTQSLVVHWDGKLLPALVGISKVERIAILVSYNGTSKFLGAPKVPSSSGENIAAAVHNLLIKWNISDRVAAMGFDTTSSNTGEKTGACINLQRRIGSKLIKLACRHHNYEIVLRSVFEVKFAATSGPDVLIFERLAKAWKNIDKKSFKSGLEDEIICSKLTKDERNAIKMYCHQKLTESHSRDDYNEFLELALIFLGERGIFRTPGPTSHARWMAKAIYCLKIFVFREQFTLTTRELNGLRDVCIFLVRIYIQAWFGCSNAISAPSQDLNFIKDSVAYAEIDSTVSAAILNKMQNHLWYLSEETMALAFFDPNVSLAEKQKIVERLQSTDPIVKLKNGRSMTNPEILLSHNLSDFVSHKTKNFFNCFGLSSDFLNEHPSTWELNDNFEEAHSFCHNLFVVNDTAERGVRFMKDYNRILTNDEEQKQLLLQIVE